MREPAGSSPPAQMSRNPILPVSGTRRPEAGGMTAQAYCSCPVTDGMIRHQQQTCTDPIVAKFGWYADQDPRPSGDVGMTGPEALRPIKTRAEASELAAVRAVYKAFDARPGASAMTPHKHAMLMQACDEARIHLGGYDRRILEWLAGWEPETCAVVAGLIARAHAGGKADLARKLAAEL
jgi:hypothetical protein